MIYDIHVICAILYCLYMFVVQLLYNYIILYIYISLYIHMQLDSANKTPWWSYCSEREASRIRQLFLRSPCPLTSSQKSQQHLDSELALHLWFYENTPFFLLIDVWCYPFRQWIIFLKKKHGRSVDDYKYEHNCRGSTNHSYLFICESTLFQQAQLLTKAKFSRRAGWLSMGHWRYWRTLTNHEHFHGSIHGWLRIHGTKTQIIIWINGSYSLILFGRHMDVSELEFWLKSPNPRQALWHLRW